MRGQCAANALVQKHLVVNRLAGFLETVGMGMFGPAEQAAHEPVMQVDDFVDQPRACVENHGHQRGMATGRFEIAQMLGCHLTASAGELQKTVLVDGPFQPLWQGQCLDGPQPLDMRQHMFRVRRSRRLAHPDEAACLGTRPDGQESVEGFPVFIGQNPGQGDMDLARATGQCFATDAFDHIDGRQDDSLFPQHLDHGLRQQDAAIGLPREIAKLTHEPPIVGGGERRQAQPCLELGQVLATGLLA